MSNSLILKATVGGSFVALVDLMEYLKEYWDFEDLNEALETANQKEDCDAYV